MHLSRWTRPFALFAALGIAFVIGLRSRADNPPARNSDAVQFTCCRSTDLDHVYHGGDTVRIHWIVIRVHHATGQPVPITLSARMVGAYTSAQQMKRQFKFAAGGPGSGRAHVTEQSFGKRPVSEIRLPNDIGPGVYSLVTTITEDGDVLTSGGSIRVAGR